MDMWITETAQLLTIPLPLRLGCSLTDSVCRNRLSWTCASGLFLRLSDGLLRNFAAAEVGDDLIQAACQVTFEQVGNPLNGDLLRDLCFSSVEAGIRDDETLLVCEQAVELAVQTGDTWVNDDLCWAGSINRIEELVFPACQRGVELAIKEAYSDLHWVRDSRGLALALIGGDINLTAAIEEFDFFVQRVDYSPYRLQRLSWIADLEAGIDPFDEKTLKGLLND
jgi:hypothetical protein